VKFITSFRFPKLKFNERLTFEVNATRITFNMQLYIFTFLRCMSVAARERTDGNGQRACPFAHVHLRHCDCECGIVPFSTRLSRMMVYCRYRRQLDVISLSSEAKADADSIQRRSTAATRRGVQDKPIPGRCWTTSSRIFTQPHRNTGPQRSVCLSACLSRLAQSLFCPLLPHFLPPPPSSPLFPRPPAPDH